MASAPPELAPFAIRVVPGGARRARLIVEGEVDLMTSPQLSSALEQELMMSDEVVLDLSRVQFIDSSGLQAIVVALQGSATNGKLKISSTLPAQAHRLFELVGVLDQLPLIDDAR